MNGIHHEVIKGRKDQYVRKGTYHVQHANSFNKCLKKWMERFQDVAIKSLDNCLFWSTYLERYKERSAYETKRVSEITVEHLRAV